MDETLPVEQTPEPVEVVTVVDAQNVLGGYSVVEDARLTAIESDLTELNLRLQSDDSTTNDGVVTVDAGQWSELTDRMDQSFRGTQLSLFLILLILCVVSAVLGTRVWSTISEGWRHG